MLDIGRIIFNNFTAMKQKHGHDRNLGIKALETVVNKTFGTAQQSKFCMCNICLQKYQQHQKGISFLKESNSMFKIDLAKMKKFYQFLSAVDHKIFFKLQMPELCFFENGEGRTIFKNKGQAFIQITVTSEMKKQIANVFVDSKKVGHNAVDSNMDVHIKYFQTVVPSFKHGLSNDNLDNKPKHFTFHSDEREGEETVLYKAHHNPDNEVAIVKYKDKGLELVSQKQLRLILKSNVKTANIQIIQAFVKPHDRQSQFIFGQYLDYLKPLNPLMFNRSLIQMKTEIGLISKYSKDYIPIDLLQDYQMMLKDMPEQYCLYQTYKMVHYIQINRDLKVKRLNTVWFKDQHNQLNFFGVMQFSYEENQKIVSDIDKITQLKDIMSTEPTQLQKLLLNTWENMKQVKMTMYKRRIADTPQPKMDQSLIKIKEDCQNRKSKMEREKSKKRQL